MSITSPRIQWMQQMLIHCFGKSNEDKILEDRELSENLLNFLGGKLGQTLLVYFQKPYRSNERNERVDTSSAYEIFINSAKTLELRNRAAFFIRTTEKELSQSQMQVISDNDVIFGEVTCDSVIGMNKVIYNYIYQKFDELGGDEMADIEPEHKAEFKKVLETFANEMQETVDSLINGVKFAEVPTVVKEFILRENKEFTKDGELDSIQAKVEEIYQSWIDTLSREIEDMDKDPPITSEDEGPRRELEKWKFRMQRLTKVNDFFKSPDYRIISKFFIDYKHRQNNQKLINLQNEMKQKKIEGHTSQSEAKDNVKYLSTLEIYFDPLYNGNPETIVDSLQSLMNSLKLISFTARYYDNTKMSNLFSKITEQMICNCKVYILDRKKNRNNSDPSYIWTRNPDELISRFQNCIKLFAVYKEKYKEAKANSTSTNKENNFEFGEHQLFGKFDQFCKRLSRLTDLFTTIKQFEDIKRHRLDSMEEIVESYNDEFQSFKNKTLHLLNYSNTQFDKDYVAFNLHISEIENNLHKKINEEFKKLQWIEKKLKLLAKYEKILTKPNLQANLKSEKIEIYSSYKKEIDNIQTNFESGRQSPKLQRNMPKISGKIKWAKHLFNRIYPYINNFKDISIKERSETELSYMTTNTLLYSYIILNEKFFEQFVESAKAKLAAPLLVLTESTGPRVNLDLYVLQLIREAKCMLRMNCAIPEAAKIILLQEEKFKKYYNELNFLVKEYNRVLSRIGRTEAENYFKSHIKDLNIKLHPLRTTVNWSSMNIDTNLMNVFMCLNKLENSINSFYEVLENRVHRNMLSIRKLDLLCIPSNPTNKNINEILKGQDEYVKEKNLLLMNKNSEIESSILDIIDGLKNYPLDPKVSKIEEKVLFKLVYDYEDKFYDFLLTATKNSLNNLKEMISGPNFKSVFKVDVILSSNKIEISPKVHVIQDAINKLAKSILFALKGINSWSKQDSSEQVSFHYKIGKDNEIVRMLLLLTGSVQSNNIEIEKYLKDAFEQFLTLWTDSIEKRINEFNNKKNKTYYDYEEKLIEFSSIEKNIKSLPEEFNIGVICLNTRAIKATLIQYCKDWKNAYSKELLRTTRASAKELKELISNFKAKLSKKVEKIEELKDVVDTIEEVRRNEGNIENQIKPFVHLYKLVKQHTQESDFLRYDFPTKEMFDSEWSSVLKLSIDIRDSLQTDQILYKKKLYDDVKNLKEEVAALKKDYDMNGPTKAKTPIDAYDRLDRYKTRVTILKRAAKNIKDGEKLFNVTNNEFPTLDYISEELDVYNTLYDLFNRVIKQIDIWKDYNFSELKDIIEDMGRICREFSQSRFKVSSKLKNTPDYNSLKEQIDICSFTFEAFEYLYVSYYEDIHWKKISEILKVKEIGNVKIDGGNFKLKLLYEANVHESRGHLEDIKSLALNQQNIKDKMDKSDEIWKTKEFVFSQHTARKDVMQLEQLAAQEVKNLLEEETGQVAGFKSQSRNLTDDLKNRIRVKEQQFQYILNTMDLWLQVQSSWSSLQSLFMAGDIRKELPGPTKQFEQADKVWVKLMEQASSTKNVVTLCANNEHTPTLNDINEILKICQRALENYLETKRGMFPRFYFVSDTVMLNILSKKSEPSSIRENLNIIFDAITDIEFNELDHRTIIKIKQTKGESNTVDIQAVDISNYPVKCDAKIEMWLNDLVDSMKSSIRDLFEVANEEIKQFYDVSINEQNKALFQKFIQKYICQVAVFGLQLLGTKKLEDFVIRTSQDKGATYKKKCRDGGEKEPVSYDFNQMLFALTELCRQPQKNKLEIVKLETLVIIHVHHKDIYKFILEYDELIYIYDYDWLKQTRVYWHMNTCIINVTDVPFEYGYEFLGSKERLCITALTDKCYITMAQALGMNYGGAPAGPAGTGKTETVKDMGRTMGVFVLVTNCAPEHRYKNMCQIFKGLCKSGAWGCFDEFNRILLEVLSVLAMIVSAIQDCRKANKNKFKFPDTSVGGTGAECELLHTTAYFITMNPGYSGRQELPENLKVLFRGVTMMQPNRDAIIRVKLSSYGFDNNDDLSKKFKKLYELCEDQLSKQKHYDFGLRNINSVLRHAGAVKKKIKNPDKEEEILYVALRDMNESKLVPDDIQLFYSLINDVFPNQASVPTREHPELIKAIKKILKDKKLDAKEEWVKKIVQVYETYCVRHGFMIVGTTGTGKTTILDVLTDAMTEIDPESKFKLYRMNPKAILNEYLYVQKVLETSVLGVFTRLWIKCNESYGKLNNWLVCDGPIDTIWIESLNTVLDDNKILTLSNNERINMIDSCRLVMECENVKNATLATVSRVGMIYITENDITFSPLINSWFERNKDFFKDIKMKEQDIKDFKDLMEKKYLKSDFQKELLKDKNMSLNMETSWLIRIKNFLLLVEAMLRYRKDSEKNFDFDKSYLEKVIIFSLVWGIGGVYDQDQKIRYHKILQNVMKAPIPDVEGEKTIFEYMIEGSNWETWKTEDYPNLRNELGSFSQLLVPTMDTTRAIFLIERIGSVKIEPGSERTHPCLMLGDPGTAKTSTVLLYRKLRFGPKQVLKRVNFSSGTSPLNFQETIDEELEAGNQYVPTLDKYMTVFLDDLSMPKLDDNGDQITLELVRQLLEFGGYYFLGENENRGNMKKIARLSFVAAMNFPKGGKNDIPNRLKRQFFIISMVLPNAQSINDVYGKIIDIWYSKGYGDSIIKQSQKLTKLTDELLTRMKKKFSPTPIKFHYNYNMRELSRTFQGIFQADKDVIKSSLSKYGIAPEVYLISIWKHEATRVFSDKLIDVEDKKEYSNIVDSIISENFDRETAELLQTEYVFCDYLRDPEEDPNFGRIVFKKAYEMIKSMDELKKITDRFMEDLKSVGKKRKPVDLVLFEDCLKYLVRITRVIQTPQGSCMIVGVGGSGKQSLTRLSAFCSQHEIVQLSSEASTKLDFFKTEFRNIYSKMIDEFNPQTGKEIIRHTFLMTDAELKLEPFLELVSSFLSTGEIASLFAKKEEKNQILSSTRVMLSKIPAFNNRQLDETEVWTELINTVRNNLHICLCFSPSGDKFRDKFINFPVLFNNCTINWLLPWPEEALISVIQGFISSNSRLKLEAKEEQKKQLFYHMAGVHINVKKVCTEYFNKMRRYVYVTPKSYLSFIKEYIKLYISKKEEISTKETTILNGLKKLDDASRDILEKNKELAVQFLEVESIKRTVEENEAILKIESAKVDQIEEQVFRETEKCNAEREKIEKESFEVEKKLAQAKPKLEEAAKSVGGLTPEVLSKFKPGELAPSLKFYFESAAVTMGKRINPIVDWGKMKFNKENYIIAYVDSWNLCSRYMVDGSFNTTLDEWSKLLIDNSLNINDETLELIRPFLESRIGDKLVFDDAVAEFGGGLSAVKMVSFCKAISSYVVAVREVKPQQQRLDIKKQELFVATAKLQEQETKKEEVLEIKRNLEEKLAVVKKEKEDAQERAEKMEAQVTQAKNLIDSLHDEKKRWVEDSKMFEKSKKQLLGDTAICAAFIAYAGPFNNDFRNILENTYLKGDIKSRGIPCTEDLNVVDFLVEEQKRDIWVVNKLPSDILSIQNGILVEYSSRYPLLIDPQSQARQWLIATYPELNNKGHMINQKDIGDKFENIMGGLLFMGEKILIEGIENEVDTKFDPILDKQVLSSGTKMKKLVVGDKLLDFNEESFKMYMLCKLINPHFSPELAAKTTIIDFNVTIFGLEQQLQGIVISKEQKHLEESLKTIISDITKNKHALVQCQNDILDNLNKEGNLLENLEIMGVLNYSKSKSVETSKKIYEANEKKNDINQKREKYMPIATRGSILYFSMVDMQEISKMYSSSLQQFEELFKYSIDHAQQSNVPEQRVKFIVKKLTEHVYKYVVRGLFEKDKAVFVLILCLKILVNEKIDNNSLLKQEDVGLFIKCGAGYIGEEKDCEFDFLTRVGEAKSKEWINLLMLQSHKFNGTTMAFSKIIDKIRDNREKFLAFYNSNEPEKQVPFEELFSAYHPKFAAFLRLMLVRAVREDRTIIAAMQNFIPTILDDRELLDPYPEGIEDIYNITEARKPVLYLLSAGADPSTSIEYLASKKKKNLFRISMGEHQEKIAQEFIDTARETGDWVLLQNCHLGLDYMNTLDAMLRNQDIQFHPSMRLWLSCAPRNEFPIGLLHQSLKVTNEPPKGIKASMIKTFSSVVSRDLLETIDFPEWRNLVFTLTFLHSLVLERRKYGPLGWCIPYDFNNSDLLASIIFVRKQFEKEIEIDDKKPRILINLKTVVNVVGGILYGGRITDSKDEIMFNTVISSYLDKSYYSKQNNFYFYPSDKERNDPRNKGFEYKLPDEKVTSINQYIQHISAFSNVDPPQVFGLHGSADMTFRLKEFNELLDTIQSTLPKESGSAGGMSKEDQVKIMVKTLLTKVPEDFKDFEFRPKIENLSINGVKGLKVPLHNLLLQEIISVQNIIELVRSSLCEAREALDGRSTITEEISKFVNSLYDAKPPKIWMYNVLEEEISWLSPTASSWIDGLIIRSQKLKEWLNTSDNMRPAFYVPGFLNPKGFFAGLRQEIFKMKKSSSPGLTLDMINLKFTIDSHESDPKKKSNEKGNSAFIIYGFYIEGAKWNGALYDEKDANSRETIIKFPVITVEEQTSTQQASYNCPLYKYPRRTDKYLITDIPIPLKGGADRELVGLWVKRGVALLCNKE